MPILPVERGKTSVSGEFLNASLRTFRSRSRPPPPGAMLPVETIPRYPIPDASPLLTGERDSRSGNVVIWGDGWGQTQHVQESRKLRRRPEVQHLDHTDQPQVDHMFEGRKMLRLCGGYGHIAVLTDGGDMIYSGNVALPEQQVAMDGGSIRYVAPGYSHTLILTEAGALYSTGNNTYGQLGHTGEGYESIARPVVAFANKRVAAIACGKQHSLCLVEGGDVYAFGCCTDGQCGTGKQDAVMIPKFVKGLQGKEVVAVAAGSNFSVCIVAWGAVYSWGDNSVGQLGLGGAGKGGGGPRMLEPTLVPLDDAASQVACGWGHVTCLAASGTVHAWGFNLHGQLGLGDTKSRLAPVLVSALDGANVVSVSCASHMAGALGRDGELWVWGSAELGRLGGGAQGDQLTPKRCDAVGLRFAQMAISDDRVMAFAPARLTVLEPDCGPLTGATRVKIGGEGVFESEAIKVTFAFDLGGGVVERRVVRGIFSRESGCVVCMSPPIDRPATAYIDVSFDNGASSTSSALSFSYYVQPMVRISPDMIPVGVTRTLTIAYDDTFESPLSPHCKVLFSSKSGEVSVKAIMTPNGTLTCEVPPIEAGHVRVQVGINGQQYGDEVEGYRGASLLMYEQAKLSSISPDCLLFTAGGIVSVMAENLLSSATIRLEGSPYEDPIFLSPKEMDLEAGAFTIVVPKATSEAHGALTVTISVDGSDYTGGKPLTLQMFGSLQPTLQIPFAASTGGLVNCLKEENLFPATEMQVKMGDVKDGTVVAGKYDAERGGCCFQVPPYDEIMSPDMATVPLWFSVDGITFTPVGSMTYINPPSVASFAPDSGPAATALTISGEAFPEEGQYFVKFQHSDGKTTVTVPAEFGGDTSVSCETPEMPPGSVTVSLSVHSEDGQFLAVPGDFKFVVESAA